MPSCQAQTYQGSNIKCGRGVPSMPYFWFRDSHKLLSDEFTVCNEHSNKLLGKLIEKEEGFNRLIRQLYDKAEHLKDDLRKGSNISEEREKIETAKREGLAIPTFKKYQDLQHEIKEVYEKIKRFREIKNFERNKTCRWCGFPLTEPEFDTDQVSNNYSHSDWHSDKGFRREVILYHTACGRQWLFSNIVIDDKIKAMVLPRSTRQHTLEDTLFVNEPRLNNTGQEGI